MAVSTKTAAASKSTVKTDVAGRRKKTAGEPVHAVYNEKAIPPVIQDFVEYIKETTGYDVDPRSVYMASALRGPFQKSEGNQERMRKRAEEIEQEKLDREQRKIDRAAAKEAREAERAEKAAAREAEKAAKAAAPKTEKATPAKTTAKTTASAKTAAKPAAKAPAAKAAATPARRRPARATASKGAEADF